LPLSVRFQFLPNAREPLKHGVSIRLSGRPLEVLLVLLARPGELITREQLCGEVWGQETFVDFEHGLNAAMNKLRRALSDSAENLRYIETVPGRGYRFIGHLESRSSPPSPFLGGSGIREQSKGRRYVFVWWWLASIAACAATSFVLGWRSHDTPATPSRWNLVRLTSDAGLSGSPALSPDGKLVAYSSDRSLDGAENL